MLNIRIQEKGRLPLRVSSFGKQLNDISNYNEAQILAGDDGWNPVENGNVLLQNLKR